MWDLSLLARYGTHAPLHWKQRVLTTDHQGSPTSHIFILTNGKEQAFLSTMVLSKHSINIYYN